MKPLLLDTETKELKTALIGEVGSKEMPLKKDGWQFMWRGLAKTEGAMFYKIVIEATPNVIEGIIMLTMMYDEMLYMNNIEVAPHNYGNKGQHENVAGCLLAFACRLSQANGKGHYKGFLTFDSKTELISLCENKYGATKAAGQKMFFTPEAGDQLIEKYLNVSADY